MCGGCTAGPASNGLVGGDDALDQKMSTSDDGDALTDLFRRKQLMNPRPPGNRAYEPAYYEHIANTLSHAVGIGPSVYFAFLMIDASHRDLQFLVSCIYGFFTTLLFSTSTTYHFFELLVKPNMPRFRLCLHIVDRAAIYFFIAASYTPWLTLRHCGTLGVHLKWLIWVFACMGILYQYCFHERYKTFETVLYVINAGGPAFAMFTMNDRSGLDMMVYGGLVYFVGVFFFKCDGRIPFAHAIWHLFVLVGAFLHMKSFDTMIRRPLTRIEIKDEDRKLMVEAMKKSREAKRRQADANPMDVSRSQSDRSAPTQSSSSTPVTTTIKTRSQTRAAAQQNANS